MATIVKRTLSAASNGRPINLSSTAGAVAIIHTGVTGSNVTDEVWIYAQNNFSQAAQVKIEFGTTATNANIVALIPSAETGAGPVCVVPGLLLQNSASAESINAFVALNGSGSLVASSAFITITGYVNRITQ